MLVKEEIRPMAKLKQSVLSLGARGTIGDTLTFQERPGLSIVRRKPIPTYRQTLGQMYQRWLYEDYAYLWRQQSQATQAVYRSAGVRFHLTGYQYWMKYHLAKLPDIVGWWKLDKNTGATTPDSSRNSLTGTIVGASPATGIIDGALLFDGINDQVTFPDSALFKLREQLTMMCFVALHSGAGVGEWPGIMLKNDAYQLQINQNSWSAYGRLRVSGVTRFTWGPALTPGLLTHLAITFNSTLAVKGLKFFENGSLLHEADAPGIIDDVAALFVIGQRNNSDFAHATIDNAILFNRPLDQPSIARWSERRYPL